MLPQSGGGPQTRASDLLGSAARVGVVEILGLVAGGAWSWLFVPFAMVVVYHYYVDGKIWRMRDAPELRRAKLERDAMVAPLPSMERGAMAARAGRT